MATDVLEACITICQFFWEQKQLNDEAKGAVAELGDYISRLLPTLKELDRRGMDHALDTLSSLFCGLRDAQVIFEKFKNGWKLCKFWVTPAAIMAKAQTQEKRAPAAVETTEPDDTFELPAGAVVVDRKANGLPVTVLGRGSFGVVGLGNIRRDDGSTELVAVKMAMPNVLADAENRPQIVTEFRKEVRLLGQIDHPNIVQCHGGITRQGDDLVMWIVMEKLEMTLSTAIDDKHLPIGRDDPQTYVKLIAGICSAMAYLHTPVGGKPIVHRDFRV
jgi:hypothetical protein